jgi:hypothetical protein
VLVRMNCVFVLMNAFKKLKYMLKGIFIIMEKIRVLLLNVSEGRVISNCMKFSFVKASIYF